jgi:hypothetical protein
VGEHVPEETFNEIFGSKPQHHNQVPPPPAASPSPSAAQWVVEAKPGDPMHISSKIR